MGIARLGYVGIATTALDQWRSVATEILGGELAETHEADAPALALRIDTYPQRCLIIEGDTSDVVFAGWEVENETGFAGLCERIVAAGGTIEPGEPGLAHARGMQGLARFRDPDGYLNELVWGPELRPFAPAQGHAGYVTGDLSLGHVMRHCARYREMVAFYTDALGFRLSDTIVWGGADASFLRCNPRHHSLALINESLGMRSGDTNHIMFELRRFEDLVAAYERVLAAGFPIIMSLGRHSNCKTVSFYFVGPSGFGIELGVGSCLVDEDTWQVTQYDTTKIWGHLLPHERVEELI